MRLPLILSLAAAVALPGCVSMSRSSAVTPLDAATAGGARVAEVRLTVEQGVTVRPEFDAIFRQRVQSRLDGCAKGARALRLEAVIERLDRANPVQVAIVGGANVLRGEARLVDPATGREVARYDIGKTIIGSRMSIFQMAESEEQLSDAFGDELCRQAWPTQQ